MVTGEWAPVLFCYSLLPQLSWRQWVREWLGGHLAATQGQPSPCLTVPIPCLTVPRQEKMNRRDTPDMENSLVSHTHSPVLLLMTFHTASAHKIQWYLKTTGQDDKVSLWYRLHLWANSCTTPLHTSHAGRMTGGHCRATQRRIADNFLCNLPLRKGQSTLLTPAMTESKECHPWLPGEHFHLPRN